MNAAIFLALTAGLLYGGLSLAYKLADVKKCRFSQFTFVMTLVGAFAALAKSFTEVTVWNSPLLWLHGGVMGVVIVVGIYVIMAANVRGPVYANWTVVNVSFLFAVFLSAVFLKEELLCADAANLLLFGVMLFLFVRGMRAGHADKPARESLTHILLLSAVFITNGLATFGSKLKYTFYGEANSSALPTVFYLTGALISALMIVRAHGRLHLTRDEWKIGALAGVLISSATILFLSAMSLPAAAVFTITQGTSLTAGVALTTLVGKERLNGRMALGLITGLLLLFAVIFREQTAAWLCR